MVSRDKRRYLLDTNVVISMFRKDKRVCENIVAAGFGNCFVSEITIAELFYGAAKSGRKQNYEDVSNVLSLFNVLPIYPALELYGKLKADLERKGQRIDEFDLLIGATALVGGMTVVTANIKHIGRIPNIQTVDWSV